MDSLFVFDMNQTIRILSALLLAVSTAAGCATTPKPVKINPEKITYPYQASKKREAQIVNAISDINSGMPIADVHKLAGEPDSVLALYEPRIKNADQIGYTHWYYIQIENPDDKTNASLMRVSTDMDGVVTKLVHWGFESDGRLQR